MTEVTSIVNIHHCNPEDEAYEYNNAQIVSSGVAKDAEVGGKAKGVWRMLTHFCKLTHKFWCIS